MSRDFPSMTALLGMLAIAGYQNRDKISEMLKGIGNANPGETPQPGLGKVLAGLGGMLGSADAGGLVNGGLGELLNRFAQSGQGDVANSWVGNGPNKDVSPVDLKHAIGPDVLTALEQQTGLSQDELLARLARELPQAVDKYTPDGRIPRAA
jgi:uncharacterized protein YidB (DUF937 family)